MGKEPNKHDKAYSTLEATLKDMVKERYGSVLQFTNSIGLPYATFDSMIRRGINNSTVDNVIKVCKALQISTDELSRGKIVSAHKPKTNGPQDILAILNNTKNLLLNNTLTLNGTPAEPDSIQLILDALDIAVNLALKRNNKKDDKKLSSLPNYINDNSEL